MFRSNPVFKLLATKILFIFSLPVFAQSFYISSSVGMNYQDNTSNRGTFTSDFTTGTVTGVNPPLDIPAGSPVSWSTDYDNGDSFSLAAGFSMDNYRFEIAYAESSADVDSHQGVNAAGIDLTNIDAGVLLTGNVGDLGVTVGELVADGQGEMKTSTIMLNFYYDYITDSAFTPYVGAGIGTARTDLEFIPSGVAILNDDDDTFVYQIILGASYDLTDNLAAFGSYTYRDADEMSIDASLLPANFDIANESSLVEIGLRFSF